MRFSRVLGSVLGIAALLCAWPSMAWAAQSKAIGFSNLVFRLDGDDEIGIAKGDFRVHILEEMRRQELNAVGAENLVFGRDESQQAELLLGGTVTELECRPGSESTLVSCRIGIEWQVLDVASDTVVYKVLSRGRVLDAAKEKATALGKKLMVAALTSMTSRKKFKKLLAESAPAATEQGYAAATLRRCPAAARPMPDATEAVLNASVLVQTSAGFGSGVVVSPDGFVATAAHVVGGPAVTVKLRDGREFPASVARLSRRLDIALLRLSIPTGETLECLPLKQEPMAVGADVYAIGSPASRDLSFSLARGIVSGVRLLDGVQYLQTDAAINRGNSGGPLVTGSGEAAAIVTFKLVGATMEGIGFGVPLAAGARALAVSFADGESSAELMAGTGLVPQVKQQLVVDRGDPVPSLSADLASESESDGSTATDAPAPEAGKRRSTEMMVGGIVLTSAALVSFVVSLNGISDQSDCELQQIRSSSFYSSSACDDYDAAIYGGLIGGIALSAVGIPLIVTGSKKVPARPTTRLSPWFTRQAAGVGLRMDL